MDVIQAIKSRKSIRGYRPDPISREIIGEILQAAIRAPSAINTQPWKIFVITGEILDRIKDDNVKMVLSGVPAVFHSGYTGVYSDRQVELGKEIFRLMNIERNDKEKRAEWSLRGFRYFDAPVAVILAADKSLIKDSWAVYDIGALAQTICLAALKFDLGTCIEEQGVAYPDVIRKHAGLADDVEPIISIALGYPDPSFPANQLVSRRASLDEVVNWLGF